MIFNLKNDEINKFEILYNNKTNNIVISNMVLEFIDNFNLEDFEYFDKDFITYFVNYFNLNDDEIEIVNLYLGNSFYKLDINYFINNEYYKNIKIKPKENNSYSFSYNKYEAFAPFFCNDIKVDDNYLEYPQIGYFDQEYKFITLNQNNITWMSLNPYEINTMAPIIEKSSGNVLVFGLGLGYFIHQICLKSDVKKVTVVEIDENIIKLFINEILPNFINKDKLEIIRMDMFKFCDENDLNKYDFIFTDVYHDNKDGLYFYLKLHNYQKTHAKPQYFYWIEETLISNIRRIMFDLIYEELYQIKEGTKYEYEFFDKVSSNIKSYLTNYKVNDFNTLKQLLSDESIKDIISSISWN